MKTNFTYHKRGVLIDGFRVRTHPNYATWAGMKSRCNNPKNPNYKNYGARGIRYCAEWEHFANFCSDMGVKPSSAHSIERIDNDGPYEPTNCKWATRGEQSLNRRLFSNSSTKLPGVHRRGSRYIAKYRGVKISGSFETPELAYEARLTFKALCESGDARAADMRSRPARYDSTTGVKGITPHADGGYLVRVTDELKRRVYLGYFKCFEDAVGRLNQWQRERK